MTKDETIAKILEMDSLMTSEERSSLWDLGWEGIPKNGLAIEVGTWKGASAYLIGEICRQKNAKLICIDLFNGDMFDQNKTFRSVSGNWILPVVRRLNGLPIHFLTGRSQDVLPFLANEIADFIFVDGDHYLPWVLQDIKGFYLKVKKGGIYLGHDYTAPYDVKKTVDILFGDTVKLKGSIWYIQKNE